MGIAVQTPLAFRVENSGIKFPEGIDDPAAFIKLMQKTLEARIVRRKYMTFAFGVEFQIELERVPMMIDHDGWAFIDCRDNSTTVRGLILRALLTSAEFREAQPLRAAAAG